MLTVSLEYPPGVFTPLNQLWYLTCACPAHNLLFFHIKTNVGLWMMKYYILTLIRGLCKYDIMNTYWVKWESVLPRQRRWSWPWTLQPGWAGSGVLPVQEGPTSERRCSDWALWSGCCRSTGKRQTDGNTNILIFNMRQFVSVLQKYIYISIYHKRFWMHLPSQTKGFFMSNLPSLIHPN